MKMKMMIRASIALGIVMEMIKRQRVKMKRLVRRLRTRSVCHGREDHDDGIGGCKGEDDDNDDHGKDDNDKSEGD